tara:strand:- start:7663 stop:8217 length:555 start_codon:yes stop_codon:yes gene_type:complete
MKIALTILLSLSSFSIFGSDIVNVAHCGAQPGFLESLFTNAQTLRVKCIDEAYEANRIKVLEESNELSDMIKAMEVELKEVAYEYTYGMIKCTPRNGQPRDEARTKKCSEINIARNSAIGRMNDLMGWNTRAVARTETTTVEEITPPCPSKEDLDKIKPVRYFNRRLYQTWERCVQLNPMNYYN